MDPHIIISPPQKPKFSKNILAGIIVGVVLLAIPLGVYLVQQRQIFKPQASEESQTPETSFTLSGPFHGTVCFKEPCPDQPTGPISVGQTFYVNLLVRSDFDAANLFKASLSFPKDLLEVTKIETGESDAVVPPDTQSCSGLSDTSCAANYSCAADCGGPVSTAPGTYSCALNSELINGQRNCPICLAEGTKISTPKGEVSVQNLKEGDLVYSVNSKNQKITSKVLRTSAIEVPPNHQVINLKLKDGRNLQVSPNHPTADGKTTDKLKAGDKYNDSVVVSVQKMNYTKDKTYDLLPDSDTGFYFANGILMGSTLKGAVKGITAKAQESEVCAQVITRACQYFATCAAVGCPSPPPPECRDFPTPCDVPFGWSVVTPPPRSTVTPPPDGSIGAACYSDKSVAFIGETVTWRVDAEGGTRPYQISWGGNDQALQNIGDSNQDSVSLAFTEPGGKQAVVRVRDQANHETTINCPLVTVVSSSEVDPGEPFLNYFIPSDQWIEKTFDNNAGTINLTGGVPNPGFKTDSGGPKSLMATIVFTAKAPGTTSISFNEDSMILRNSDNQDILQNKYDLKLQIGEQICPGAQPLCKEGETLLYGDPPNGGCPVYKCVPGIQGKGDGNKDGKIDLVDLSILLSNYNKNKPELDFNDDGIINGLDYGNMIKVLVAKGVIKASN